MKSYEEVAKSVFEKSENYFMEKARKARRIKTAVSSVSCVCLAAAVIAVAGIAMNGNLTENPLSVGDIGEQLTGDNANNANIPVSDETTATETQPLTTLPELTPDENGVPITPDANDPDNIWDNHGEVVNNGVYEPFFLAFDGALYVSYDSGEGGFYESIGLEANLAEHFTCEVYIVQGRPDHIGVKINSFIREYKKVFDCNFDIDGTKFQIAYSALKDIDHACGDIVLQTEDFTVYEAVRLQGEPSGTKEYIVDLLPSLQREFPNLFDELRECGFDDYGDAWWIALSNNDIPDEYPSVSTGTDTPSICEPEYDFLADPSLPLDALIGTDPGDVDYILAQAEEAAYSINVESPKSVWVAAEKGSEIYSLVDGVVVMAEYHFGFGFTVEVETADGQHVKHFHLSEMLAEVGDTVTRGQVIGLAGTTGAIACSGAGYSFITDNSDTHHTDSHHSDTHH